MTIQTFDTILTELCDTFDDIISPQKIARANTNIIYLLFKAVAKGLEIINNACVIVNNKFNPASCSEDDLDSVATLVGTTRREGSGSGLNILITNENPIVSEVLIAGTYYYMLDEETIFYFDVLQSKTFAPLESVYFLAMTDKVGSFYVQEMPDIEVNANVEIPESFKFSCQDNGSLLGIPRETSLEFRRRIQENVNGQDVYKELEEEIKALPYIFDCVVRFNNTQSAVTFDRVLLPPFTCAIFYSGSLRQDLGKVIANKVLCPTLKTDDSIAVKYESPALVNGFMEFNLIPFKRYPFSVDVKYKLDQTYTAPETAESALRTALLLAFTKEVHSDFVREADIYDVLQDVTIDGCSVMEVQLRGKTGVAGFLRIPPMDIPYLEQVNFLALES